MTNENDSDSPPAKSEGQPSPQSPMIPSAPPKGEVSTDPKKSANADQNTATELAREFRWVEGAQLVVNGVLAIVGIIALLIYHGQLTTMNGQLTEMQEARRQAKIDNAQAIAAQQQIAQDSLAKSQNNFERSSREAQESFRADQRAWVGVSGADLTQFEANKPLHFDVALLNTGKTPARKTHECTGYVLSRIYLKEPPSDAVAACERVWKPSHDLPPQGRFVTRAGEAQIGASPEDQGSAVLLSQSYDAIKTRVQIFYIFGEYEYRDLTGKTRTTRYCLYLANPDTKTVQFCDGFNDMD